MEKEVKLITCTGYYNTGSSAIGDLLREFENVQDFGDYEVRFAHEPDGLSDLEYNIVDNNHRHNTSNAIKRFIKYIDYCNGNIFSKRYRKVFGNDFKRICHNYIEELTQLKCNSWWQFDQLNRGKLFYFVDVLYGRIYKYIHFWEKNDVRSTLFLKNEKAYYTYMNENEFIKKTQKFTDELIEKAWNKKSDYLVLDQLIPPSNISRYERYFKNLSTIVVDRDPRDIYLLEMEYPYGVVPTNVKDFCKWYRIIREHRKLDRIDSKNTLFINFEDLVYHYDIYAKKICDFVGIDINKSSQPKKYFDPSRSIKNTRKSKINKRYCDEIKYIEEELSDYLYDYSFIDEDDLCK